MFKQLEWVATRLKYQLPSIASEKGQASTPDLEKYNECSSEEELAALKGTNKGKINGSNIFILAPFMTKSLTNAKNSDPIKLIPIAIDAAKKFDEESNDGSQLAIEYVEALAIFL